MKLYKSNSDYLASKNSIVDTLDLDSLLLELNLEKKLKLKDAWISLGGWQSWNPSFEIEPGKAQPSLHCHLIKQWNRYLEFPCSKYKPTKNTVLAQFVSYLRWDDFYICFVSTGNINSVLPPVQFVYNRKNNNIKIELCDTGKQWKKDDVQCQLEILCASSFFELKDKLQKIFGSSDKSNALYNNRFDQIQFLGEPSSGWESWYNHYANINEDLILEDLKSLQETKNLITLGSFKKSVFQIDDGWEKALGTWELNTERFPSGFESITAKIDADGYIPGLWIAPFIVDLRSKIATEHPEWVLKNKAGKPIAAGFNPLWGAAFGKMQPSLPNSFFCLDLSISECVEYLDGIIETAINQWGFRYLKLDFLYAGMIYGNYKNGGAGYEWYSKAIKKLTSRKSNKKGEEVTYLGCGLPLELSFNDFPLSRIGCDTYEHWENNMMVKLNWNGRASAYLNLKDTIGHAMTNKIIYSNDPDVVFIRNENCSLTRNQKLTIATVAALFGNQVMYSDDPAKSTSEEEVKLTEEIIAIFNKFKNEEFSVKTIRKDYYEVSSRSGTYKGYIDMEEGYADIR